MDRAERVANELFLAGFESSAMTGGSQEETEERLAAILRREFQAVERKTWMEAAQTIEDEFPESGKFVAAALRTQARMVGQEGSQTLSARTQEAA